MREQEHAIVLKEGVSLISVRPYKYLEIQKDEIEPLIREMLEAGINRLSMSLFFNLVLLVKDES